MKLTEIQNQQVAAWLEAGLKLSEIQSKLAAEFGANLTYMEVKFLLADLSLKPKDQEPPKEPAANLGQPAAANPAGSPAAAPAPEAEEAPGPAQPSVPDLPAGAGLPGEVSVSVDQFTRAGTMISGKVTFSDGEKADWYIDQTGRLGLTPAKPGYRPPQADLMIFQTKLQMAVAQSGY